MAAPQDVRQRSFTVLCLSESVMEEKQWKSINLWVNPWLTSEKSNLKPRVTPSRCSPLWKSWSARRLLSSSGRRTFLRDCSRWIRVCRDDSLKEFSTTVSLTLFTTLVCSYDNKACFRSREKLRTRVLERIWSRLSLQREKDVGCVVLFWVYFYIFWLLPEITLIIELCIREEIKHVGCAVLGKQSSGLSSRAHPTVRLILLFLALSETTETGDSMHLLIKKMSQTRLLNDDDCSFFFFFSQVCIPVQIIAKTSAKISMW